MQGIAASRSRGHAARAAPRLHSQELAKAASDANGVSKISAAMISDISDPMKEGCLEALAVMCAKRDESRRVVINSKVLPVICASLGHSNAAIRRAACRCTQSLSRSASHIRIALADATVLEPFLELLSDESTDVRLAAGYVRWGPCVGGALAAVRAVQTLGIWRPENWFARGGWHGRPAKEEGGGVPEMGFCARPFVLCKDGCCRQRRRNTNFGLEIFFTTKFSPTYV